MQAGVSRHSCELLFARHRPGNSLALAGVPHVSLGIKKAGLSALNEGQSIEYEEITNRGKTSAENLKIQR
jgi:hypothetical protein